MTFQDTHRIIKSGDQISFLRALGEGLDPCLSNKHGWTLLMLVAMEGNTRIGNLLLNAGADINAANDFGDTALSLAAHAGHIKFARWIVGLGASVDCHPHGHDMATWIKISSGLSPAKLTEVLAVVAHPASLH